MWVREINLNNSQNISDFVCENTFTNEPQLFMLFGESDLIKTHNQITQIANEFPNSLVVGCSTGTIINGRQTNDTGISGVAIGFEDTKLNCAFGQVSQLSESFELGVNLAKQLPTQDLVAIFILCDGLFINGSTIIEGMKTLIGDEIPISGGLAGDGERFVSTKVIYGNQILDKGAIAIGFYSKSLVLSHASFGGWYEFGPEWKITKSHGNIVYEIEDMPAIELYDDYVGSEKMALQASALLYPLKVWPPDNPDKGVVRAIMNVDRQTGSLTFAGDVPENWHARLMHGNQRGLIDGAKNAAIHAFDKLQSNGKQLQPEMCFIVSCVARRILLGTRTKHEIEAISQIIGDDIPMTGFYSYGEISPQNDSLDIGLHNQTLTLTLMTEAA